MRKVLAIVFICFSLFSCSHKTESKYEKSIDSLNSILVQTDSIYRNIDWNKATDIEKIVASDLSIINSKSVKWKKNQKELIDNYKLIALFGKSSDSAQIDNSFSQEQNKKYLFKQIKYSFSQLENLKSDIQSESLKDDKIKEYLSIERKAIQELFNFTSQKSEIYKSSIQNYESLKPQIDDKINSK